MKLQEISPGYDSITELTNSQVSTPYNIKLIVEKTIVETEEDINAKALVTDIHGNPVPNVEVSWRFNIVSLYHSSITDDSGIAKMESQSFFIPNSLTITAKCNDISSETIIVQAR